MEINLSKAKYEFLVLLLSNRESLSRENKIDILAELVRRTETVDRPVNEPH